jgi:hypothetical protein
VGDPGTEAAGELEEQPTSSTTIISATKANMRVM